MVSDSRICKTSLKEAHTASVEALKKCGFQIVECKENSIKATSGPSLWSWGENIEIHLTANHEGVKVEIFSSPIAQFFDWGKSRGNISNIFSNLELILSKESKR
jgi:hypothetical protein